MDTFTGFVNKLDTAMAKSNAKAITCFAARRLSESVMSFWGRVHANQQPLPKSYYEKFLEQAQASVLVSNWILFSIALLVSLVSLHYVYLLWGNYGPAMTGRISKSKLARGHPGYRN
jgi:hypothetical protein